MQIANLAKKLEATGLTEKQARVYVASLFLGASAVQRIAEQAEVNRATTYVILAELAEMGLVSESVQGKKTVFVAEPPEAIERYLSSIERAIVDRKAQLKGVMTDLHDINRAEIQDAPVVRFFKGPEAARSAIEYVQRKSNQNIVVYSVADTDEVLKLFPDLPITNAKKRIKKAMASQVLYSGVKDLENDPVSARVTKRLKDKAVADISMFEDSMVIMTYGTTNSTSVIIENKTIVSAFRQLFELGWKSKDL